MPKTIEEMTKENEQINEKMRLISISYNEKVEILDSKNKTFSFDEFLEYGMNSDEAEIEEGKLVYFEFEYHSVFRENDDLYQILFDGVKHPITPMCMIGVIDGEIYIVA